MAGHADMDALGEWQRAMTELVAATASSAFDAEKIGRLIAPQTELVQTLLNQQQAYRAEVVERLLAPLDRLGDLLDEVAEPMRRQVEAIHEAAAALERVAALLDAQLALVDRARLAWRDRAAALRPDGSPVRSRDDNPAP